MSFRIVSALGVVAALGACVDPSASSSGGAIVNLPEAVIEMAAPNQDLSSVRVLAEDGCYWYLHQGPVESTLLPLRNTAGRPICTSAAAT